MTIQEFLRRTAISWCLFTPLLHSKPWTTTFDPASAWQIGHARLRFATSSHLGINLRPCMLKLFRKDARRHHPTPLQIRHTGLQRSLRDPRQPQPTHPSQDRAPPHERSLVDRVGVNRRSFLHPRHHLQPSLTRTAAKIKLNVLMRRSSPTKIPWMTRAP